ncbi:MAG: carboxymuconolactone decarboxylase family protein [Myxococcales bacterium]|nr:carboxymuconolactone decarboxylase family protein [Myxococcales bacterium]
MKAIDEYRASLPEEGRDLSINLQSVLADGSMPSGLRYGIALAAALAVGDTALADALRSDGSDAGMDVETRSDARAAAALMAMNNVYYRFRHMVGKPSYSDRPARLRMQRIVKPASSKAAFELMCLAVSAVNGCELCVQSHERTVLAHGMSEEQVHDAVRIAAAVAGAAAARRAGAHG